MKNKDYRELQLSSSQLFFIFLGILILGVIIFLLGVSVGKRQAQIVKGTEIAQKEKVEQAKDKTSIQAQEPKESISKELASLQKVKETQKQPLVTEKKTLFYVQVGAFNRREAALSFAEEFKQKGYPTVVFDPFPTDRKQVFRVRVGGFNTREEAEEVNSKLKSESKKKADYFIIKS